MNKRWTTKLYKTLAYKTTTHGVCARCGIPLTEEDITIEHMIPKSDMGSNAQYNLCLLCEKCNTNKGSILYDNAIESYPYLCSNYQLAYDVMLVSFSDMLRESEVVAYENIGLNVSIQGE